MKSTLSRVGAVAGIAAVFYSVQPVHAAVIVDDDNHVIWSNNNNNGFSLTATNTESGVTLGVNSTSALVARISSNTSSDFSLNSENSIELNVEGISFSSSDMAAYNQQLIFAISNSPSADLFVSSSYAVGIFFDANKGFRMGFKNGTANAWPWGDNTLVPLTTLSGVVTGFALTLTSGTYSIDIYTDSLINPVQTFNGAYSLGDSGWDALGITAQYRKGSAVAGYGGVVIDDITLRSIPEPSVVTLFLAGLLILLWRRYRHQSDLLSNTQ